MSLQFRFTADTPHGRFATNSTDGQYALVFRSRNPESKADVVWLKTEELAVFQTQRLRRLGFDTLGTYRAVERVDEYLTRASAPQVDEPSEDPSV